MVTRSLFPRLLPCALACLLVSPMARAGGPATYSCKIKNGQGALVETASCLPSCDQTMTEACCNDILRFGQMNGLQFSVERNPIFSFNTPWQKDLFGSGKNACVLRTPGRFGRDGVIRPEGYGVPRVAGVLHVILEGTGRISCDGGEEQAAGSMLHFACTKIVVTQSGTKFTNAKLTAASKPTADCYLDVTDNSRTLKLERTVGYFHLPRGVAGTAQSKTSSSTVSPAELATLQADLEGSKGITGQLKGYKPDLQHFTVKVSGQASCGVGTDQAVLEYCKPSRTSQQSLATKRATFAWGAFPAYLVKKGGWTKVSSTKTDFVAKKTFSGVSVTARLVPSGGTVKDCRTDADCKLVQGATILVLKETN